MNRHCPVCGNPVDSQQPPAATYQGDSYQFCSEGCQDQFLSDPASYAGLVP